MTLQLWLAYTGVIAALIAIPGPSALISMTHGLRYGRRQALATVSGGVLAAMMLMTASALGLGAILAASTTAFTVLKVVGAAYLIWLGIAAWRDNSEPTAVSTSEMEEAPGAFRLFRKASPSASATRRICCSSPRCSPTSSMPASRMPCSSPRWPSPGRCWTAALCSAMPAPVAACRASSPAAAVCAFLTAQRAACSSLPVAHWPSRRSNLSGGFDPSAGAGKGKQPARINDTCQLPYRVDRQLLPRCLQRHALRDGIKGYPVAGA